jgi:hypothetical protein
VRQRHSHLQILLFQTKRPRRFLAHRVIVASRPGQHRRRLKRDLPHLLVLLKRFVRQPCLRNRQRQRKLCRTSIAAFA